MVPKGWREGHVQDFLILQRGFDLTQKESIEGEVPVYSSSGIAYYHNEAKVKGPGIVTGRKGSVGPVYMIEGDFWPHDTTLWVKDFKGNDVKYIEYFLKFLRLERFDEASSVPTLNRNNVHDVKCVFPPFSEQIRIAKILSVWDKAITTIEQLLANSQQQKKALMQKLLTGKVRFLKNGANKFEVRKGYSKSRLGALPSDWCVETIRKNLWFQEGPGVRNFQFTESGVKLFNGTNIQFNNISLSKTTTHISEEEAFGAYKHFLVDAGDLLIACSGISVDRFDEKIAFAGEEHLPLCMNTSTMRFKTIDSNVVDIRYFQYFMQSNLFKNQIRRQATGSAQLNFGPSHVAKSYVVLPSFQEQQKIASLLSLVDEEIRAIQRKLDLLKDEKAALMQQLLTGKRRVKIN